MVRLQTHQTSYPHPFPLVSLAYFLRYPNPYSKHVLSTDTISRHYDPETQRLTTVRLHLKQSKLPATVMRMLPTNLIPENRRGPNGEAQNYVLETSTVDAREGWMETETRNLMYTGVLTVVERQRFERPAQEEGASSDTAAAGAAGRSVDLVKATRNEQTDCTTQMTFISRFGQGGRFFQSQQPAVEKPPSRILPSIFSLPSSSAASSTSPQTTASSSSSPEPSTTTAATTTPDPPPKKQGFLASWSASALQRTIEASSVSRTRNALQRSKEGMLVVMERIRAGGLGAAVEGMRRDAEEARAAAAGVSAATGAAAAAAAAGGEGKKELEGVWVRDTEEGRE